MVLHLCTRRWDCEYTSDFILPLPFLSTSFVGVYVFYQMGDGSEGSRPRYSELPPHLGLINFYRRFLPQAATKLEPLNRLLKAHTPWGWGKEQESAFSESKKTLVKSSALVHFHHKLPLVVVADSSAYGIGSVLCHLIDGVERPICFASRTLTSAERNHSQLEKDGYCFCFTQISLLFVGSE